MNKTEQQRQNLLWLAESALMIAIATVLTEYLSVSPVPYGGSITIFGQVPMLLIAYRYRFKKGLITSLTFSLIQLLFGLSLLSYIKTLPTMLLAALLDYVVAFSALALGGLFRGRSAKSNQVPELCAGAALALLLRFLCHFLSGFFIWREYANLKFFEVFPALHGFASGLSGQGFALFYSLCYNLSYMLPETIISLFGLVLLGSMIDFRGQQLRFGRVQNR